MFNEGKKRLGQVKISSNPRLIMKKQKHSL